MYKNTTDSSYYLFNSQATHRLIPIHYLPMYFPLPALGIGIGIGKGKSANHNATVYTTIHRFECHLSFHLLKKGKGGKEGEGNLIPIRRGGACGCMNYHSPHPFAFDVSSCVFITSMYIYLKHITYTVHSLTSSWQYKVMGRKKRDGRCVVDGFYCLEKLRRLVRWYR